MLVFNYNFDFDKVTTQKFCMKIYKKGSYVNIFCQFFLECVTNRASRVGGDHDLQLFLKILS